MKTKTEQVACAFCKGKGTDPYNILSSLSQCAVCDGKGTVTVPVPHVACSFCHGSGSDKSFRCPVCKGIGVMTPLPDSATECPDCGGRSYEASSGMYCQTCGGRGRVVA